MSLDGRKHLGSPSDLGDRDHDVIVGTSLSIPKTAELMGFSRTTVSSVYTAWCGRQKNIQRGPVVQRKRSEVIGQTGLSCPQCFLSALGCTSGCAVQVGLPEVSV